MPIWFALSSAARISATILNFSQLKKLEQVIAGLLVHAPDSEGSHVC